MGKYCRNCGSYIDDNANYCPNCGEKIKGASTSEYANYNSDNNTNSRSEKSGLSNIFTALMVGSIAHSMFHHHHHHHHGMFGFGHHHHHHH